MAIVSTTHTPDFCGGTTDGFTRLDLLSMAALFASYAVQWLGPNDVAEFGWWAQPVRGRFYVAHIDGWRVWRAEEVS